MMWACRECGTNISAEAEVCPRCGLRLKPAPVPPRPPGIASIALVVTPPPSEWSRMADALVRLVLADERLAGLETPVRVEVHERGVGYSVGESFAPTSVWIHAPRWWEPPKRSRAAFFDALLATAPGRFLVRIVEWINDRVS